MLVLLGISSLISLIASLVLGIRLLRLASRTHGIPELAMGAGFVLGGFLGLMLILIGNPAAQTAMGSETSELLFRTGMTLLAVGVSCTYVFVWQTFRRDSALARVLSLFGIGCIFVSLWPIWSMPVEAALTTPMYFAGDFVRGLGMFWGCVEALGYHTVMRRRLKLGLASALVTNRFLLWGIAMAAGVGTMVTSTFMTATGTTDPNAGPYLVIAILATVSPAAQWLAFFPPRWYGAWIERRAAAAS